MKKNMFILWGFIALVFCNNVAMAQGDPKVNLRVEARGDYHYEEIVGENNHNSTGFRGSQLNLRLNGEINDSWSYAYRQRMAKPNTDASYFDAVDHINLTYATGKWAFIGGKQTVAVGGYEYDRAPIDFYFGSEYWYNMACYQWGVNARYTFGTEGNNALNIQLVSSPFANMHIVDGSYNPKDMYAYNVLWAGKYGWLDILHSVNVLEYVPGKYVGFLALGHQFNMGPVSLQLDWMSRTTIKKVNLIDDYSIMADLSWKSLKSLNVFGKVTYDVNKNNFADYCVLPGTEVTRVGAGVEFFPIEDSQDVRLHCGYSYAWGKNKPSGTVQNDQSFFTIGATWKMDILKKE
jgi:hypothetical protein